MGSSGILHLLLSLALKGQEIGRERRVRRPSSPNRAVRETKSGRGSTGKERDGTVRT